LNSKSKKLKNLKAQKKYIIANNVKMAQFNLNTQSSFEEMKEFLLNLNNESVKLNEKVNLKINKIKNYYEHYSIESIQALMLANLQDDEETSEKIVNKFLNKEINLDQFLKDYLDKKTKSHLRRIKTEKFTNLVYNNISI
jgi:monomeric isocitrate dehydrogenase